MSNATSREIAEDRERRALGLKSIELLKAEDVAELLDVDVATLAAWRSTRPRDLPFVRLGRRSIRYRRGDVERFIAAHLVHTSAPAELGA